MIDDLMYMYGVLLGTAAAAKHWSFFQVTRSLLRSGTSPMAPPTCPRCGNTNMFYDIGTSVCDRCGTVVEENTIVAEVTFGESSNGAAIAHGKNVPAGGSQCILSSIPLLLDPAC